MASTAEATGFSSSRGAGLAHGAPVASWSNASHHLGNQLLERASIRGGCYFSFALVLPTLVQPKLRQPSLVQANVRSCCTYFLKNNCERERSPSHGPAGACAPRGAGHPSDWSRSVRSPVQSRFVSEFRCGEHVLRVHPSSQSRFNVAFASSSLLAVFD